MDSLSAWMSGYCCVCLVPKEIRKRVFGTRITDVCELPYGFRESNPGPLEELMGAWLLSHHFSNPKILFHFQAWIWTRTRVCAHVCVCLFTDNCGNPKRPKDLRPKKASEPLKPQSWSYRELQAGCLKQQRWRNPIVLSVVLRNPAQVCVPTIANPKEALASDGLNVQRQLTSPWFLSVAVTSSSLIECHILICPTLLPVCCWLL